ncbi:hypothetical protein WV31_09770 [Magnetospirillum sp. ME-1]|uniref:WG repeat-containing protein n=1 Tax=Magnetospirillum sp. ME-1 TaxID=1639348 RepID=UPI000A17C68B|nr:WG repeat-containing protein [Magnetospirillum sp. ME-1]ARJ65922.1 hypothetical protein WV31_09770 [Magnetospirillum sp. ME-1]
MLGFRRAAVLFLVAVSVGASFPSLGASEKIAYSEKQGIAVIAQDTGEGWCKDLVSLKITAKDIAFFQGGGLEQMVLLLGTSVLPDRCPKASSMVLDGVTSEEGLVFQGTANRQDGWKPSVVKAPQKRAVADNSASPPSSAPPAKTAQQNLPAPVVSAPEVKTTQNTATPTASAVSSAQPPLKPPAPPTTAIPEEEKPSLWNRIKGMVAGPKGETAPPSKDTTPSKAEPEQSRAAKPVSPPAAPTFNARFDPDTALWQIQVGDLYGFMTRKGEVVLAPAFDEVTDFRDGLAAVKFKGEWKIIDRKGTVIAELGPGIDSVSTLNYGFFQFKKAGKYGLLTADGKVALAPAYYSVSIGSFTREYQRVIVARNDSYSYALVDLSGREVLSVGRGDIREFHGNKFIVTDYTAGTASLIDKDGAVLVTVKGYLSAAGQKTGRPFLLAESDGKAGMFTSDGRWVIELGRFETLYTYDDRYLLAGKGGKVGLLDLNGKELLPLAFQGIRPDSLDKGGLVAVKLNGSWGAVDSSGKTVIPAEHSEALGVCPDVTILENPRQGKVIVYDHSGTPLYSKPYQKKRYPMWFLFGCPAEGRQVYGLCRNENSCLAGFLDLKGTPVITGDYNQAEAFSNGLARVKENKSARWGIIDIDGKIVQDFAFNDDPLRLAAPYWASDDKKNTKGLLYMGKVGGKLVWFDELGRVVWDGRKFKGIGVRDVQQLFKDALHQAVTVRDRHEAYRRYEDAIRVAEQNNIQWPELFEYESDLRAIYTSYTEGGGDPERLSQVAMTIHAAQKRLNRDKNLTAFSYVLVGSSIINKKGPSTARMAQAYQYFKKGCDMGSQSACDAQALIRNEFLRKGQLTVEPVTTIWVSGSSASSILTWPTLKSLSANANGTSFVYVDGHTISVTADKAFDLNVNATFELGGTVRSKTYTLRIGGDKVGETFSLDFSFDSDQAWVR